MWLKRYALTWDIYNSNSIRHYIHKACWLASHDGLVVNYASAHCCTNVGKVLVNGPPYPIELPEVFWQANLLRHMVKYEDQTCN